MIGRRTVLFGSCRYSISAGISMEHFARERYTGIGKKRFNYAGSVRCFKLCYPLPNRWRRPIHKCIKTISNIKGKTLDSSRDTKKKKG
jgi:hypothetical protein